ncbi:MAG: GNAT family N-acetyltransferase [Candidatus Thermoplasmatota archaeon]|nr:GNAT family N-acetyltransferase [Candidatus Thermoplasmatota archaeon]
MNEDERIAVWLDALLEVESDLRVSRGVAKEALMGSQKPRIIILEEGEIAGYAELRRIGGVIELATVVVEPQMRGKGFAHRIVHQAWERWRQDPILHGSSLGGDLDLSKVENEMKGKGQVARLPLISFTRDAAMGAALLGGGFTMIPRKRRASRLWLWKSDFAALPIYSQLVISVDRLIRGVIFLFKSPSRIAHFMRNSRNYRLFVRVPETAERLPPRLHLRSEGEGGVSSDVMDQMEALAFTMAEIEGTAEQIAAWDEGE